MAILEVEDLEARYGAYPVLHGISFEVEKGETCVLFGLNGAGKTTTVSVIAGLLAPSRGTVRYDGESIGGKSPSWLVSRGISLSP
ncbi:MAG: branched-chain amino acid transport system ATP-binding protein, partial [Acidimicrobiaceae bacterium]